jgi:hypothetical protein
VNDTQIIVLALGALGSAGTAIVVFLRWAVTQWTTVRREDIEATKATAAAQRAESGRMVDALLAQATSNAVLGGRIEASNALLTGKLGELALRLDTVLDSRDFDDRRDERRSPSETRRRLRTVPHGHRIKPDPDSND